VARRLYLGVIGGRSRVYDLENGKVRYREGDLEKEVLYQESVPIDSRDRMSVVSGDADEDEDETTPS